jgi:hypothetical protein
MCFSAPASFIVGTLLTSGGVFLLYRTRSWRLLPLAAFPLIFGIQQLTEGVTWLTLGGATCLSEPTTSVNAYLFLSHIFWPIFTPLTILFIETSRVRRRFMFATLTLGIATALTLLSRLIEDEATGVLTTCSNGLSLVYGLYLDHPYILTLFYFISTVGSLLLASDRRINYFGFALFIALFISLTLFYSAHISVWCFFAAILSVMIFKIIQSLDVKN